MVKQKEAQTTVETPADAAPAPVRAGYLKKYVFRIVLLAAAGAAAYGLWKNPQIAEQARGWFKPAEQSDPYAARFAELQNQMTALQNRLDQTNYKIDASGIADVREQVKNLERINLQIIDSKADAAAVLGVVTRLDAAEQKIGNLSAVTDSGALLLTGVLLVKDAADRGQTFEYEAEVLSQIAADNPRAVRQVEKIKSFAASGIPSDMALAIEFDKLHTAILGRRAQPADQNWKQRLNTKLNEIVQVKKLNDGNLPPETGAELKQAEKLIKNGDILRAAALLTKSTDPEIADSAELRSWAEKVRGREEFYQAVSMLSADALASLKVNNLRKVRGK